MFLISNRQFDSGVKVFPNLYVKGNYFRYGDFIFFACGEFFEPSILKDVFLSLVKNPKI